MLFCNVLSTLGGKHYREVENIHSGDDPISVGVKQGEFKQVSINVDTVCLVNAFTQTR